MEQLKHECGVAMVRLFGGADALRKNPHWGINSLYLLMEKQRNRGQEGAGIACIDLEAPAGKEYIFRERALGGDAIQKIFDKARSDMERGASGEPDADGDVHRPFIGQVYLGHLRYSTTGRGGLSEVHPFLRRGGRRMESLCLCGNFNLTNVDGIFEHLLDEGLYPRAKGDTFLLLEQLGGKLDSYCEKLIDEAAGRGLTGKDAVPYAEAQLDIAKVLRDVCPTWDGGFVVCGATGSGEQFAVRDRNGIRPAFWYADNDICIVASERSVIQTTLNLEVEQVNELERGQALIIDNDERVRLEQILEPGENLACSFERIYFSRGSDRTIYQERKALGRQLVDDILGAIDYDLEHTVVSFIPNTAETSFYGMVQGLEEYLNGEKLRKILLLGADATAEEVAKILRPRVRIEKVAWKDIKMRTFITEGKSRSQLAAMVYDVTYGSLQKGVDTLVVIDDSIVRGTTLRESILRILDRLHPKKIVVVSSSPQIRYPDFYGIDMSRVDEFIAFRTAVVMLGERGMKDVLKDTYELCKAQLKLPKEEMRNEVKNIYRPFTAQEISEKMAVLLRAADVKAEVQIIFQSIEGLHAACPDHRGDWYFTGDYPTPGGNKMVNEAYVKFYEDMVKKHIER